MALSISRSLYTYPRRISQKSLLWDQQAQLQVLLCRISLQLSVFGFVNLKSCYIECRSCCLYMVSIPNLSLECCLRIWCLNLNLFLTPGERGRGHHIPLRLKCRWQPPTSVYYHWDPSGISILDLVQSKFHSVDRL
jgi:hypothetical protein